MFGITGKSKLKATIILLFSVFCLWVLNISKVYAQSLDSPVYNNKKNEAVEAMDNSNENDASLKKLGGDTSFPCFTVNNHPIEAPVINPSCEFIYILTLIGGGCWAILGKKSNKKIER